MEPRAQPDGGPRARAMVTLAPARQPVRSFRQRSERLAPRMPASGARACPAFRSRSRGPTVASRCWIPSQQEDRRSSRQAASRASRLANVRGAAKRVEHWRPQRISTSSISRAFRELGDFCRPAKHLVAPGGFSMLAMKGVHPFDEIARSARVRIAWTQVRRLRVPGSDAEAPPRARSSALDAACCASSLPTRRAASARPSTA